jgi:hypothetical protein
MKTKEDEAFDDLAKKQGSWGGGFPAKRRMAADKQHWNEDEWRRNNWRCGHGWLRGEQCEICNASQPVQEPVAWRWGIKKLNGGYEWRYTLNKTRPDSIPLYAAPQKSNI